MYENVKPVVLKCHILLNCSSVWDYVRRTFWYNQLNEAVLSEKHNKSSVSQKKCLNFKKLESSLPHSQKHRYPTNIWLAGHHRRSESLKKN